MSTMSFHYGSMPANVYICRRASTAWQESSPPPCEEAFKVLVEYDLALVEEGEWAVMIPDLETLQGFIDKYGDCIIKHCNPGPRVIMIYDDYVE